jgi:hypothetical protein
MKNISTGPKLIASLCTIPELSRKPLVGEMGALRAISCIPVEGEPDYYRM